MKSFKDNAARSWTVAVNVDAIKRIRALCGVDLLKVVEDKCKLLGELAEDAVMLVDVLYAACKPDADALGISDADFGRAMAGDAIYDGFNALVEDLIDFFPQARRSLLRGLMAKIRQAGDLIQIDAMAAVNGIDPARIARDRCRTAEQVDDLVWRLAGIAGVNPGPLTLCELDRLATARERCEWERTSSLVLAILVNVNRTSGPVATPDQFNPYRETRRSDRGQGRTVVPLAMLCNMLLSGQGHAPALPVGPKPKPPT